MSSQLQDVDTTVFDFGVLPALQCMEVMRAREASAVQCMVERPGSSRGASFSQSLVHSMRSARPLYTWKSLFSVECRLIHTSPFPHNSREREREREREGEADSRCARLVGNDIAWIHIW